MTIDPRAVAARWPDARRRALAALTVTVTEAPWTLDGAAKSALAAAGLDDDAVLHAVALAAYFGHLNRIADATGVPLDYAVTTPPPATEPAVPPLATAPAPVTRAASLTLAQRPATAAALAAWTDDLFARDPAYLPRATRADVIATVAAWLGAPTAPPAAPLDPDVHDLVALVALAPWQLADASFAALRARGWDDAALFDLCAVTSTATVTARIDVALRALG